MQSIRRMGRHKNKPKKNAAAVSPAAIPAGETEVIVEKTIVDPSGNATPVVNAEIDTPAPVASFGMGAPLPTFTQIGMAGMIGMLQPVVAEPMPAVAASAEEPVPAEEPMQSQEPMQAQELAQQEPVESSKRCPTPPPPEDKCSDSIKEPLNESLRSPVRTEESATGFYGYIKHFFRSIGGAISR